MANAEKTSTRTEGSEDSTMRRVEDLHPEDTVTRSSNTSITLTQTIWRAVETNRDKKKRVPMTVVTMNAAESMNVLFPEWVQVAYTGPPTNREYKPYDLNMPIVLPHRAAYKYRTDPPLTEHGKMVATIIARGMRKNKLASQIVYSAPEMVAVQTAQCVSGENKGIKIRIDPALANWRGFSVDSKAHEHWESAEYYNSLRYPIDTTYKPTIEASKLSPTETPLEYHQRLLNFYTRLVKENKFTGIIIVGHPSTVALTNDATFETKADLKNLENSKEPVSVNGILFGIDAERDVLTRPCLPLTPTLIDARERKRRESGKSLSVKKTETKTAKIMASEWSDDDDTLVEV
uniref:ATP-dependent DNA helicase n=1 Tax=Panagrellus redivivus TaxID=6233 RepID=A0A7E4UZD8_PANRE